MAIPKPEHYNLERAARVAALYVLDCAGLLEGMSAREVADLLGDRHRGTAWRYLRDVAALRELVPQLLETVYQRSQESGQAIPESAALYWPGVHELTGDREQAEETNGNNERGCI